MDLFAGSNHGCIAYSDSDSILYQEDTDRDENSASAESGGCGESECASFEQPD